MHDMIGSAGMLRGWVDVWTAHMLWLLATLTLSIGAVALVELLTAEYRRAVRDGAALVQPSVLPPSPEGFTDDGTAPGRAAWVDSEANAGPQSPAEYLRSVSFPSGR
jgi:hypothetical protein